MLAQKDSHAMKHVIKMYWKLGQIRNHYVKDTNIFLEMSLKIINFDIFLQFLAKKYLSCYHKKNAEYCEARQEHGANFDMSLKGKNIYIRLACGVDGTCCL